MTTLKEAIHQEDIIIDLEQDEDPEIIDFEQEELEEFSGFEEENEPRFSESKVSTQTQKRGNEVKKRFDKYIENNIVPRNSQRVRDDDDHLDGQLMMQLQKNEWDEKVNQEAELFILMFNKKPEHAIQDYVTKGFIHENTPDAIAAYLIKTQGVDKAVMGQYFGKNDPSVLAILHSFCRLLNFKNMEFDKAMRLLLSKFRLPGQAQQIERVIWEFALAFYETNKDIYDNADELFPLAYAIIMLATDAHNPKQEKKMTCEEFVNNTRRPCPSIGRDYLIHIYERITKEAFQTETDYFATIYGRLKDLAVSNIKEAIDLSKELIKGDIFLKICRSSTKYVQRRVFLSEDESRINWVCDPPENDTPRFLLITDIKDLTLGIGSAVMKKNKVNPDFDSLCFTITTHNRTLDLKARTTKERGRWINYLRAILIQRREKRRQQLEQKYKSTINNDVIEQIWNNDVFPFWDRHWDYRHRKPKEKGYIARGLEALCSCWNSEKKNDMLTEKTINSGLNLNGNLLQGLWKHGLPKASRKTLWPLIIGNSLNLTPIMVDDIKKRKKEIEQFKTFEPQVRQFGEMLITLRPDLPPVRDLLLLSRVFISVFPPEQFNQTFNWLANFIHGFHFLSFYHGTKSEIELRIQFFEYLMQKNAPTVKEHFKGIRLQTRMFLVGWFLSLFSTCFEAEFLMRVWDNFVLQGELYLFKVGIALIKYYEVQLKMCTFNEGLKMLKYDQNTSEVLFFHILEEEIDVSAEYYEEYIEKRRHAKIKTEVQSIPLE